MPPLGTPGHSLASLGQSLVGSLLLSPGFWCTQGFVCDLQKEAGQRLTEFCQEKALVIANNKIREDCTHGHHQMVNPEIRLIIFSAAKDGEVLYSQQKQDWELTVAQIMNALLPNSDLN